MNCTMSGYRNGTLNNDRWLMQFATKCRNIWYSKLATSISSYNAFIGLDADQPKSNDDEQKADDDDQHKPDDDNQPKLDNDDRELKADEDVQLKPDDDQPIG